MPLLDGVPLRSIGHCSAHLVTDCVRSKTCWVLWPPSCNIDHLPRLGAGRTYLEAESCEDPTRVESPQDGGGRCSRLQPHGVPMKLPTEPLGTRVDQWLGQTHRHRSNRFRQNIEPHKGSHRSSERNHVASKRIVGKTGSTNG